MIFHECLLHRVHFAICAHSFDGLDGSSISLHRKNGAALHCLSIEMDSARSTTGGVATNICSSELEMLSQVMNKKCSWFHVAFGRGSVDGDTDFHQVPLYVVVKACNNDLHACPGAYLYPLWQNFQRADFGYELLDGKRCSQCRHFGADNGKYAALRQGDRSRPIGWNSYFGGANFQGVRGGVLIHDGQGASDESHDVGTPKLAINNANSCIQGDCWALR